MATIVSTIVLFYYAKELPELIPNDNLTKEMIMCSGQLIWQGAILLLWIKRKVRSYLFQMITVSLLGSIALIPFIIWYHYQSISIELRVLFFLLIVSCMIIEHSRRVKKLTLPSYLTITWVAYRIFWLPILLF